MSRILRSFRSKNNSHSFVEFKELFVSFVEKNRRLKLQIKSAFSSSQSISISSTKVFTSSAKKFLFTLSSIEFENSSISKTRRVDFD